MILHAFVDPTCGIYIFSNIIRWKDLLNIILIAAFSEVTILLTI